MRRATRIISEASNEGGVVITLVAVVMLFVVGAMAALAIDVVSLYTARSEAQLVADSAALAGARVLANSGATSNPLLLPSAEVPLAKSLALQVAQQNKVGGIALTAGDITVTFGGNPPTDPTVTVRVQETNLPTFFSRIWGNTRLSVAASATAEAYNPSGGTAFSAPGANVPVAPVCVKPWLLPNIDPTQSNPNGPPIFYSNGAIVNTGLVGQGWPGVGNSNGLYANDVAASPIPGRFYPGSIDALDFTQPTQALPVGSGAFTPYELAIAGCVPRPIACGQPPKSQINVDTGTYASNTGSRDGDTVEAVNLLIHDNGVQGADSVDPSSPPFQFVAGTQNPVVSAVGKDILVSDSLVTIPVYDSTAGGPPSSPVTVVGFLQVFLNPLSSPLPFPAPGQIPVTIVNMAGCGTTSSTTPIIGNGASPVAVRLISAP